jgi:hypothetical protein
VGLLREGADLVRDLQVPRVQDGGLEQEGGHADAQRHRRDVFEDHTILLYEGSEEANK